MWTLLLVNRTDVQAMSRRMFEVEAAQLTHKSFDVVNWVVGLHLIVLFRRFAVTLALFQRDVGDPEFHNGLDCLLSAMMMVAEHIQEA